MQQEYPMLHGYTFSYEYPGIFTYLKGLRSFCFSPDWSEEGHLCIQVFEDGVFLGGEDIAYGTILTPEKMVSLIENQLLKY
jgi:hypothetical protein